MTSSPQSTLQAAPLCLTLRMPAVWWVQVGEWIKYSNPKTQSFYYNPESGAFQVRLIHVKRTA